MARPATAMLFSPPRPPLQLDADAAVVVGRSRSCDLRLSSSDASRRHAEIVPEAGGYVVRDLGSTNGTFVNGERIDRHALEPGDRIQIGAETITFCQVDGGLERSTGDRGEEQTQLFERPVVGETFQGDLAEIPVFAVLQILEMGRKTGALEIDSAAGGRLWLVDGVPVHAETREQRGFDAAVAIVNAGAGRFRFDPQPSPAQTTIQASVTELLLEASRLLDENRAATG